MIASTTRKPSNLGINPDTIPDLADDLPAQARRQTTVTVTTTFTAPDIAKEPSATVTISGNAAVTWAMRPEPNGFADGTRHGWMDRWCALLARILAAEAAERLLSADLPRTAGLVVLPSFIWRQAGIDVGRKDRARDGGRLLMPIRTIWPGGPVALATRGAESVLAWEACGLGVRESGRSVLIAGAPSGSAADCSLDDSPPGVCIVPMMGRKDLVSCLERIRHLGREAEVSALLMVEDEVASEVRAAHRFIVLDSQLSPDRDQTGLRLLDEEALSGLTNRMLLGEPGRRSAVQKMITKALQPDAFAKVDPQKFARTILHRSAQLEIRNLVGDPPIGSKIRRIARDLQVSSPERGGAEKVLAACQQQYPGDKIGADRVLQALSLKPVVLHTFTSLYDCEAAS